MGLILFYQTYMTKAEEILKKYPSVKIGLDDHYGKQTVINALNEALGIKKPSAPVKGYSNCPFCGGTKTTPFIGHSRSQNCTECNKDGKISNSKLVEMGLEDMIDKVELCKHTRCRTPKEHRENKCSICNKPYYKN